MTDGAQTIHAKMNFLLSLLLIVTLVVSLAESQGSLFGPTPPIFPIKLNLPPLPPKQNNKFKFGLSREDNGSIKKFSTDWNNQRFGASAIWDKKTGFGGSVSGQFDLGSRGVKLGGTVGGGGGRGIFGNLRLTIPIQ